MLNGLALTTSLILISSGLLGVTSGPVRTAACPYAMQVAGECANVGSDGRILDLTATRSQPRSDGSPSTPNNSDSNSDAATWPPPAKPFDFDDCIASWDSYNRCFRALQEADPSDPAPEPAPLPVITISDLAQFAPPPTAFSAEPDNAGIAGLPANFLGAAASHTATGALFGFPVTVRFTPIGYDYSYGDGTAVSLASGGQTWEQLGQAAFTPTPTSHVYAERGTYTVTLTVRYSAEIDLGSGWFPVTGELTTTSPSQTIRIYEAHTALVAHTCTERPDAPGC